MSKLRDFFYYYDHKNPHHLEAVDTLNDSLATALLPPNATWVRIYRTPVEAPKPANGKSIAAQESVRQPFDGKIDWHDPNCKVSQYFTVGEVTRHDRRRIPVPGSLAEANIVALAQELDRVREAWGSAIGVSSWYRPDKPININALAGGVENSQHITGGAVDVYPLNGKQQEFETWLDQTAWQHRALGYGMRSGKGFTHLDLRSRPHRWYY